MRKKELISQVEQTIQGLSEHITAHIVASEQYAELPGYADMQHGEVIRHLVEVENLLKQWE